MMLFRTKTLAAVGRMALTTGRPTRNQGHAQDELSRLILFFFS